MFFVIDRTGSAPTRVLGMSVGWDSANRKAEQIRLDLPEGIRRLIVVEPVSSHNQHLVA